MPGFCEPYIWIMEQKQNNRKSSFNIFLDECRAYRMVLSSLKAKSNLRGTSFVPPSGLFDKIPTENAWKYKLSTTMFDTG